MCLLGLLLLYASGALAGSGNQAPVLVTSSDGEIPVGTTATLSARATDADGDDLDYRWQLLGKPNGSHTVIESPETATTGLRPDRPGLYRIEVTVSDGINDVTRSLRFDAVTPRQGGRYQPLPAHLTKRTARSKKRKPARPRPAACPPPENLPGRGPVALLWHAPDARVDGNTLPEQLRFRVYRAVVPAGTIDCAPYRHCLRRAFVTSPGQRGERQRFTDPSPPAAPLCYAVTTFSGDMHESGLSNLLLVAALRGHGEKRP